LTNMHNEESGKHNEESDSEASILCAKCGNVFKRKEHLLQHEMMCRRTDKRFDCAKCGNLFGFKQHLVRHMTTVHKESEDGNMVRRRGMRRRRRTNREVKCSLCNTKFKNRRDLLVHKRLEHPIKCSKCGQEFGQTKVRDIHEGNCDVANRLTVGTSYTKISK
jgi:uncharacterized C2H2 Zn-finger protein